MKLSVVIPTHNRAEILKTCLEKLSLQKGVDFEVIVVDDGSFSLNEKEIANCELRIANFRYIPIEKAHQGVARNRGVKEATGEVVVFIGDDIFVEPDFLKWHHDRHAEQAGENVVVLGFSTWDPALEINDYMRFLESSGWQFGYEFLKPGFVEREDRYKFFYTSNISMKKRFFEKEPFSDAFAQYGWEDIELGYRLQKNHGMKLFYEPQARALHHHLILPTDLPRKMRAIGGSAVHFERLQPAVKLVPRGMKRRVIKLATNPVSVAASKVLGPNIHYKLRSWKEFMVGVEGVVKTEEASLDKEEMKG